MNKKILFKRMRKNPFFVIGSITLLFIVLSILILPNFIDFDPLQQNLADRFIAPEGFSRGLQGHVLGTDQVGRDVFIRILIGGRTSLFIALIAASIQLVAGLVFGLLAGYYGGIIDTVIMRLCDILLGIPVIVFAIAVIAMLGDGIPNLILVMSITNWVYVGKVIRNDAAIFRSKEFVKASRAFGASNWHIMFKQILPNVTTNLIILTSQNFGGILLVESTLSFLNLGVPAPNPSWGNMISAGRKYLITQPWLAIAPGVALLLLVLSLNFLGDGLREVLDPKESRGGRRRITRRRIARESWQS